MVHGCACLWVSVLGCWIFKLLCPIADLHLPHPFAPLELDFWVSDDPVARFLPIFIYAGFPPTYLADPSLPLT
nr:hypothetical protein CFP56_03476 [Quercus suber]